MDISILTFADAGDLRRQERDCALAAVRAAAKLPTHRFRWRDRRQKTGECECRNRAAAWPKAIPCCCSARDAATQSRMPFRSARRARVNAIAASEHVSQCGIPPVSLAYVSQHGIPFGRHLRRVPPGTGKTSLVPHLSACRTGAIDVVVTWGEPIRYDGR